MLPAELLLGILENLFLSHRPSCLTPRNTSNLSRLLEEQVQILSRPGTQGTVDSGDLNRGHNVSGRAQSGSGELGAGLLRVLWAGCLSLPALQSGAWPTPTPLGSAVRVWDVGVQ